MTRIQPNFLMKSKIALVVFLSMFSFGVFSQKNTLKTGIWRAEVSTVLGKLPFQLLVEETSPDSFSVFAVNGEERLLLDAPFLKNDSLHIPMELFDAEIIVHLEGETMNGIFRKRLGNLTYRQGKFTAQFGNEFRFIETASTQHNVQGKWETMFESGGKTYEAVGVFKQQENQVTGTFLTTTGDYRYLQGNIVGDSLKLSCFDGNHLFLFTAKIENDRLVGGKFCSSFSYTENWNATRNENAKLPDAESLTFLKEGYDSVQFSFKNEKGEAVSFPSERYKNKVTILQIMGSWCPNCMDETKFLVPFYAKNKGIEIIGITFEKSIEPSFAYPKIQKLKERFRILYEVVLGGINDKAEAAKALPMLNHVMAFPTMLVIDKKGKVRYIHTGFSGPGTGEYYDRFVTDFNRLMEKLMAE
jgi:thiol-disulfide isomerase/thioredoxin